MPDEYFHHYTSKHTDEESYRTCMLTYVYENVDLHIYIIYNDFHVCERAFTLSSNKN